MSMLSRILLALLQNHSGAVVAGTLEVVALALGPNVEVSTMLTADGVSPARKATTKRSRLPRTSKLGTHRPRIMFSAHQLVVWLGVAVDFGSRELFRDRLSITERKLLVSSAIFRQRIALLRVSTTLLNLFGHASILSMLCSVMMLSRSYRTSPSSNSVSYSYLDGIYTFTEEEILGMRRWRLAQ